MTSQNLPDIAAANPGVAVQDTDILLGRQAGAADPDKDSAPTALQLKTYALSPASDTSDFSAISGLIADWDASIVSARSALLGPITTLSDVYGGGVNATQSTLANCPNIGERLINNLPALEFDGAGDAFTVNLDKTSGYTIFCVCQLDTLSAAKNLFNGATGALQVRIATTGVVQVLRQSSATLVNGLIVLNKGATNIIMIKAGSWGSSIRINGVDDTSSATDAALTQNITALGGLTSTIDGLIGQFLIYGGNLSGADVSAVEALLTAKWT